MSLLATNPASLHALLLLSDSALPLGSFAFSSGLESFLAHRKQPNTQQRTKAFNLFLNHSLSNLASTALPYVLSAYHDASILEDLDNDVDASTPCTVARRASIAQGKALLTIWERALALAVPTDGPPAQEAAGNAISAFAKAASSALWRLLLASANRRLATFSSSTIRKPCLVRPCERALWGRINRRRRLRVWRCRSTSTS
jgi:urease accessory protein UreF